MATTYELSHLRRLSRPSRSTSSARWRPSSSGRCCCSRAARTRSSCCAWRRRPSGRRRLPFPVMHIDTGHNFHEVLEFRDRRVAELGVRLVVGVGAGVIDAGRVVEETGPAGQPQPAPDRHAARRHRGARLRRRVRRRPARRGEGPGQGAGVQLPRRVRPVGPEEPAPRAVEPLQRPPPQGRAHPRLPALNWTELDIWQYIAEEEIELPSIYFAHRREVFRRDGMLLAGHAVRRR